MPASSSTEPKRNLGLSFSGGGYRAAAFSLGTMTLLQDLGLMEKVKVLSSVSGGSVTVSFYICSKAAKGKEFNFQDNFYTPLLETLQSDGMANAFVQLKHLLSGTKLIKEAADHLDKILKPLFEPCKDSPTFGNSALNKLLYANVSPDYVFFNTTNITTLGLFRFGLQRNNAEDKLPVFLLNKYFLKYDETKDPHEKANALYDAAKKLRIADCVAASFAFPGGFEPLIFPDDFFDSKAPKECESFRKTPICDRQKSVAFLDGGLYDNLGLASIEDIRRFTLTQSETKETPIIYVIATDADNIQPGISFYSEPEGSSSRELQTSAWHGWMKTSVAPLFLGVGRVTRRLPTLVSILKKPKGIGWMQRLGMPAPKTDDNSLAGFAFDVVLTLLSKQRHFLLTAVSPRRIGQLLPAFNGYLKRTRSLTYGYLQQTFERETESEKRCYLIRNMIFELSSGLDPDPDSAMDLITLPVSDYRKTLNSRTAARPRGGKIMLADKIMIADKISNLISVKQLEGLPEDLQNCHKELKVDQVASTWLLLQHYLAVEDAVDARQPMSEEPLVASPIRDACCELRNFLKHCNHADEQRLLIRAQLFPDEAVDQPIATWIPLLCEMATNLGTTLWLSGYHYYVPNRIEGEVTTQVGQWYSYLPPSGDAKQAPGIDFSTLPAPNDKPAANVAIVVGYLNTCFNILEFFHARLQASPEGNALLNQLTAEIDSSK